MAITLELSQQAGAVCELFDPVAGYLNAATMGLPPRSGVRALQDAVELWRQGQASAEGYDLAVSRSRALYAELVGVPVGWVATGSQTSVTAGTLAASLPDGARVVCVRDDFSSVTLPFQQQAGRGVRVRQVPLAGLAEAVLGGCDLVAYSLAQSADGSLADDDAVLAAAAEVGALTFCDTTQAVGWLDVDASRYDVSACAAYKWLCAPRGAVFTTIRPEALQRLTPVNAGWYAGESIWQSCYGPDVRLASDARRFDVSPAWLCWTGTVPALELFVGLAPGVAREHGAALADAVRARMGLPPQRRPVLALSDPDGDLAGRLADAGCTVASRAGRVRLAFHLWNDASDVERVTAAVGR